MTTTAAAPRRHHAPEARVREPVQSDGQEKTYWQRSREAGKNSLLRGPGRGFAKNGTFGHCDGVTSKLERRADSRFAGGAGCVGLVLLVAGWLCEGGCCLAAA